MSISQLAQNIKEPATLRLTEQARQLKERGEPVIHLGAGEPKSRAPFDAILSCSAKLISAEIRYTPTEGIPALVNAVMRYTRENYETELSPHNVIVSTGAKQSFYTLMLTIIDPEDEAVIFAPYWVSYPEIIRICRGKPVVVNPPTGSFLPQVSDIESAITSKTKVIVVNSPNNPSGAIYPKELIERLVRLCEEKDIYLVMDDIYHQLTFDGCTAANSMEYLTRAIDDSKVIVLNGVSKIYAMTGFRIGWAVGNKKVIKAMVNLASQNFSCPSAIDQAAAVGALEGDQSNVESLRLTLQNNRNLLVSELASIRGVKLTPPKGTFYCLPDFSYYNSDSESLAKMLLEKALVVTIPGVEFGMEGHLRISVCGSASEISEGIARIKWALDPDSPDQIYIGDKQVKRTWL